MNWRISVSEGTMVLMVYNVCTVTWQRIQQWTIYGFLSGWHHVCPVSCHRCVLVPVVQDDLKFSQKGRCVLTRKNCWKLNKIKFYNSATSFPKCLDWFTWKSIRNHNKYPSVALVGDWVTPLFFSVCLRALVAICPLCLLENSWGMILTQTQLCKQYCFHPLLCKHSLLSVLSDWWWLEQETHWNDFKTVEQAAY